jgi:hypothetical protein
MKNFACNYAIARFRPYRETGEFVNVGVVLLCPQLDFFGQAFERRKHKRITDFFPELDFDIFKTGLAGLLKELSRVSDREDETKQFVHEAEAQMRIAVFKELVRTRESLFHFGEVGTVLTHDPKAKLAELFDFYIRRQFARDREYQEIIMRRKLGDFLQKVNLARFYKQDQRIGDDNYHVVLPFVHFDGNTPRKAIKPLHMDKPTTTDIYRHGDAWVSTVKRLRQIDRLPKDFLFAVRYPGTNTKGQAAAQDVCNELEKLGTQIVPFANTEAIKRFAEV